MKLQQYLLLMELLGTFIMGLDLVSWTIVLGDFSQESIDNKQLLSTILSMTGLLGLSSYIIGKIEIKMLTNILRGAIMLTIVLALMGCLYGNTLLVIVVASIGVSLTNMISQNIVSYVQEIHKEKIDFRELHTKTGYYRAIGTIIALPIALVLAGKISPLEAVTAKTIFVAIAIYIESDVVRRFPEDNNK